MAFLDLDGPILDVSLRHYRLYVDSVASLGGTALDFNDFWAAKRSKTPDADILRQSALRTHEEAYKALKLEGIEAQVYLAHDRLQPKAKDILSQLALRYQLVLVTLRRSRESLERQLEGLEIAGYFDHLLSGPPDCRPGWETKVALVKDEGIIIEARSFFAGDTETDILAGRAMEVSTVAVCNGIRDESILRALSPDWTIPTIADLSSTALLR